MHCSYETICETHPWQAAFPHWFSLPRPPHRSSRCCQICFAHSETTATMAPSSCASCQMAALNTWGSQWAMLSKWLCTQMAQQPLPWGSDTTQLVCGSWQNPNSSLFWGESYGILPMGKHLPTKKSMRNVLQANFFWILRQWVCIIQGREKFSNQACVSNWPRHDQFSLK